MNFLAVVIITGIEFDYEKGTRDKELHESIKADSLDELYERIAEYKFNHCTEDDEFQIEIFKCSKEIEFSEYNFQKTRFLQEKRNLQKRQQEELIFTMKKIQEKQTENELAQLRQLQAKYPNFLS